MLWPPVAFPFPRLAEVSGSTARLPLQLSQDPAEHARHGQLDTARLPAKLGTGLCVAPSPSRAPPLAASSAHPRSHPLADLASLASFLDGKTDIAVPPSHILGTQPHEPSSPELTDSASPASSNGLDSTTTNLAHARQQHARAMQQQAQHHPDKRKNGTQGAGAIKDSRRTSGGHHSHPTGEDGEISRSTSDWALSASRTQRPR